MKVKLLIVLSILLLPTLISAKNLTIKFTNENNTPDSLVLLQVKGEHYYIVDVAFPDAKKQVVFKHIEQHHIGMYRVAFPTKQLITLLFNSEDIEIECDPSHPTETIKILSSKENRIYYDFNAALSLLDACYNAIYYAAESYPIDEYRDSLQQKFNTIQKKREQLIHHYIEEHKGTLAATIIVYANRPFTDISLSPERRVDLIKEEYFYGLDFSDTILIYSDIYTNKIIEYSEIYANPEIDFEEYQQEMIDVVDRVLGLASGNDAIFEFLLRFFIDAFEQIRLDETLAYISENWASQCDEFQEDDRLKQRLANYEKLTYGKIAPDFSLPTAHDKTYDLFEDTAPFVLLLFYASECSHCHKVVNGLKKLENEGALKNVSIVTLSLDKNKEEWLAYVDHELPSKWTAIHEEKIWDGPATSAYSIYATPSLFLLDNNKAILAKPITLKELTKSLKDHKCLSK